MSQRSAPVLTLSPLLLLLLLLIDASSTQTASASIATDIGCSVKSCAALDVALLVQEYVTGLPALNDTDQRPDELSCDESLPFGALASDWTRLMLLQNSQPEGTPLRDNLLRLSRLVLAAYFDRQDHETTGRNNSSPRPESEDQQAKNARLGSTVQKDSARINASSFGAHDNEKEETTGAEKFAGNDGEDSTPTSYYADSSSANFNQAFSTLVSADNEASGSKSNETLAPDNEDESTPRTRTESWLESLSSTLEDSDLGSAPGSQANEAVHARSQEDFLISRYASKERRADDDFVARFFAAEHDSMEDLLALMELEEAEAAANSSSLEDSSFEFNTTGSLEALLESMERLNATALDPTTEEIITEENSTPNLEDFTSSEIFLGSSSAPDNDTSDSLESDELAELLDGLSAEDNPTTTTPLVHMISGQLSSETTTYSNEASTVNGRTENRSEEYTDSSLSSLHPTTDKASIENSTSHPVEETMISDDLTEASSSTNAYEAAPQQSRGILTIFRHGDTGSSSNKLRGNIEEEAEQQQLSAWPTEVASIEEATFNSASSRNRLDPEAGIAEMNKRKRSGASKLQLLDAESQYRTFQAVPGQTQFAEKRPDEEEDVAVGGSLPQ